MCFLYLTNMRFRVSFAYIYSCNQTNNIRPTWSKSQDGWRPMQPAAICSRIPLEYNVQVGCYSFYFDLTPTIYCSGHPTSFHYHLPQDFPLLFVIIYLIFSTTPYHGSSESSAWYWRIGTKWNDKCFIQYTTHWDTATLQTPVSPLQHYQCSHWKYHPIRTFDIGPQIWRQHEQETPHDRMCVQLSPGSQPSTDHIIYSWCMQRAKWTIYSCP